MKQIFFTGILSLIFAISVFSQTPCVEPIHSFNIPSDEPCVPATITLTPENTGGADAIKWIFANGEEKLTSDISASQTINYENKGVYNVSLIRIFNSPECQDTVRQEVNVYGAPGVKPSIIDPLVSCAEVTQTFRLTIGKPVRSDLEVTWDFGDGTQKEEWGADKVDEIISHTYTRSTCQKNFTIQGNPICTNCIGVIVLARNGCLDETDAPRFGIEAPIMVYNKPVVDFGLTADSVFYDEETDIYHICTPGLWETENNTESGKGEGCEYNDTLLWEVHNLEGELLWSQESRCESEDCDSLYNIMFEGRGLYSFSLTQRNNCGSDTKTIMVNLRDKPQVYFDIGGSIECYPAYVHFRNLSSDELEYYKWDYGDESEIDSLPGFQDVEHLYIDEGEYKVSLTSEDLYCTNIYDTTLVFNKLCEDLYVPNAFIPESSDERFREFKPIAHRLLEYKMEIYSLMGELLWTTTEIVDGQPQYGWDGKFNDKECPTGMYMWKIDATFLDGMGYTRVWKGQYDDNDKRRRMGKLALIR